MRDFFATPRVQVILILLIATASVMYVWHAVRYTPRLAEIELLSTRDRTLTRANELARRAVGGDGMERVRRAIDAHDRQAAAVGHLLPPDSTLQPMLPVVSRTAEAIGIAVTGLSPAEGAGGRDYDTKRYTLTVQGSYHRLGAFLAEIGSLEQIVRVRQFSAEVLATARAEVGLGNERLVEAKMILETYVRPSGDVDGGPRSRRPSDSAAAARAGAPGTEPVAERPHSTYMRDSQNRLWQLVHVPGKPNPVRIPVTAAGRADAEAWLNANRGR